MEQQKIGSFLKTLRGEKGMTQAQLAERFGVSDRTVSRWETGVNMPDLSLLVELADFYDVDIREIIDGERKSENMDNETKETLLKVSDYAAEEKRREVKKTKRRGAVAAVLGLLLAVFVAAALNFFFGNPVSKRLAMNNAKTILSIQYYGEGYVVADADYWIEDMEYFVRIENPSAPDTAFYMNFGMFGNYRYDNHDEVVDDLRGVKDRLTREYNAAVSSVAALRELPGFSFAYGEIATEPYDFEAGKPLPAGFDPIKQEELRFDMAFDLAAFGARAGRVCVELEETDLTAETLAERLTQISAVLHEAGVRFSLLSVSLVDRSSGGDGTGVDTVGVWDFPCAEIDGPGLAERVAAAMEQ